MKKLFAILIIVAALLSSMSAYAGEVSTPGEQMFNDAKKSLAYFEACDYKNAALLLKFADAEELEKFISGNYLTFGAGVQTDVSVAWWNGSTWELAVPLYEPADPMVETLVLTLDANDNAAFCGYSYALWGEIEAWIAECDYVIWNQEYIKSESFVVFEDD